MTKLKCKIGDFREMINIAGVSRGGKSFLMEDLLIEANGDRNIQISATNKAVNLFSRTDYKKIRVLENGNIAISDVSKFSDFLQRFGDSDFVTVSTVKDGSDNKILIERELPKKIASILQGAAEHIESSERSKEIAEKFSNFINIEDGEKDFKGITMGSDNNILLDSRIEVDVASLLEAIGDAEVIGGKKEYPFSVEKNSVTVEVGDEKMLNKILTTIPARIATMSASPVRVKLSVEFSDVVSALKGEVKVYLGIDVPVWVTQKTESYSVKYLLSPIIE